MHLPLIRLARRTVSVVGIAFFLVLVTFALLTNVAPLTGHQAFVIIGGSMEPTIPIGSLAITTTADPASILAGDVVTVRGDNGVVVTHRVSRIVDEPGGRSFEMKGDANASPDGGLVPTRAVIGIVALHVPVAGYAREFMGTVPGMIAAVAALGALYLLHKLLAMLETAMLPARARAPIPS